METKIRFQDRGEHLYDCMDEFLVHCPACSGCARVLPTPDGDAELFSPRRLVCGACGRNGAWDPCAVYLGVDHDPYFRLPLWLSAPCCGETLWAYNARHLEFMTAYVRAELREKRLDAEGTLRNKTLANRLPRWMKLAKNREKVLRAMERLRERLP